MRCCRGRLTVRARRLARSDRGLPKEDDDASVSALCGREHHRSARRSIPRRRTRTRRSDLANWTNVWASSSWALHLGRHRDVSPWRPENHPRWLRALGVIDSGVSAARALCSPLHRLREAVSGAGCYALRLLREVPRPEPIPDAMGSVYLATVVQSSWKSSAPSDRSRRPSAFVNRPRNGCDLKRHERYKASRECEH